MDVAAKSRPFSFRADADTGVLVVHGFTGATVTVQHLGLRLHQAGFNVEGPQLSGHGGPWADLARVSWTDWVRDVDQAHERLAARCSRIFAAGLSMGGALCLDLAARRKDLAGLILVNQALFLSGPDWLWKLLPVFRLIVRSVPSRGADVKDPEARMKLYDRVPLAAVSELSSFITRVRVDLGRVTAPTLVFKSRADHVIPARSALFTMDRLASTDKELVWLDNSYHVATMDFDRDVIADKAIEFIQRIIWADNQGGQ